ncbi:MAG: type IV pilus twitching motility protein PilT [Candidatus Eiseniibacteriota bacterium]
MPRIDSILQLVQAQGASDLHLVSGSPPMLRTHGELMSIEYEPLSTEVIVGLLAEIMTEDQFVRYQALEEVDFAYEVPGVVRLRCNVYQQANGMAAAFRLLPTRILTVEQLGLPPQILRFAEFNRGLVVVTGPPGCGKSTTLAAIVDHINRTKRQHVITLEDPIEYIHQNHRCLMNQREVGRNTRSFSAALKAALREDPNVILVGEMRDRESLALAISAAETGQLVLGSLHTQSAIATVDRILDAFPADQQNQVRAQLSESLKGVVAQRLLRRKDGRGRVAAVEILFGTPAVANLIRERKTFQISSVMQTSKRDGMQTYEDAVLQLVRSGVVAAEEAMGYGIDADTLDGAARQGARASAGSAGATGVGVGVTGSGDTAAKSGAGAMAGPSNGTSTTGAGRATDAGATEKEATTGSGTAGTAGLLAGFQVLGTNDPRASAAPAEANAPQAPPSRPGSIVERVGHHR